MQDRIETSIDLKAPIARVWRAITDHEQFGAWFRVALDGPFVVGELSTGWITYPGYEHMKWEATVVAMETERLFSYRWCPYLNPEQDEGAEKPTTLVELRLEAIPGGTRVAITESGFSQLPDDHYTVDALRRNTEGWNGQVENIRAYVES